MADDDGPPVVINNITGHPGQGQQPPPPRPGFFDGVGRFVMILIAIPFLIVLVPAVLIFGWRLVNWVSDFLSNFNPERFEVSREFRETGPFLALIGLVGVLLVWAKRRR